MISIKVIFGVDGDFGLLEELDKIRINLEKALKDKVFIDFDFNLLHQGGPIIEVNNKRVRVYSVDDVIRVLYRKVEYIDDGANFWHNRDDGNLSMGIFTT